MPAVINRRGRPRVYPDRLFLKALVIMIVRRLTKVHTLLAVLDQPTDEMRELRVLLTENGRYPSRRTFERRLKAIPEKLPAQIGCLGRCLVTLIRPWDDYGRAAAIDSTVLRACGGVWHKKDREAGKVPHTSIDTEAHWTKSGWHGWAYGWKLHLVATAAAVWIPLAATLTPANAADNGEAPALIRELPAELRVSSQYSVVEAWPLGYSQIASGRNYAGLRAGRRGAPLRARSSAASIGSACLRKVER